MVPFYELGEIRLRAENIVQTTGIAPKTELLLKVARVDSPASVDDALSRIHAYLVALEYAGQLSYADFRKTAGGHTGGALTYIRELETRRRETPGLAFIINVDRKIRKKVHQLLIEQRGAYPTYSDALHELLTDCAIYWTEARLDSRTPQSPPRESHKRRRSPRRSSLSSSPPERRRGARGKKTKKERKDKKEEKGTKDTTRENAKGMDDKAPRVPPDEWKALNKEGSPKVPRTCRFYNQSCGCTRDKSPYKHACWSCVWRRGVGASLDRSALHQKCQVSTRTRCRSSNR